MHSQWPELLHTLFHSNAPQLREALANWPEQERLACFKAHKADLLALLEMVTFRTDSFEHFVEQGAGWSVHHAKPRFKAFQQVWPQLQAHQAQLADHLKSQKLNVASAPDSYLLALNVVTAWAGLAKAADLKKLGKWIFSEEHTPSYDLRYTSSGAIRKNAPESLILSCSQMLLLRFGEQALEPLLPLFEDYRNVFSSQGFYEAVCGALQAFPAEAEALRSVLGKAVFIELQELQQRKVTLPFDHLLAGFAWRNSFTSGQLRQYTFPRFADLKQLMTSQRAALQLPDNRRALAELILERLLENSKKENNQPWLTLYELLALKPEEKQQMLPFYLQLLNAATPNALQLGLQEVKPLLAELATAPAELLTLLSYNLSHPVQKIAKESFAQIKMLCSHNPTAWVQAQRVLAPQLMTPHKAVRELIFKWLQKGLPKSSPKGAKNSKSPNPELKLENELQQALLALHSSGLLDPLEQERLQVLLPAGNQGGNPPEPSTQKPHSGEMVHQTTTQHPLASAGPLNAAELAALPARYHNWAQWLSQSPAGAEPAQAPFQPLAPALSWLHDPPFARPQNAEELQALLLRHAQGQIPVLVFEQVAQAVLAVPLPADLQHAHKLLDPLWKTLQRWQGQDNSQPGYYQLLGQVVLALLAQAWLQPHQATALLETLTVQDRQQLQQSLKGFGLHNLEDTLHCRELGLSARLEQPEYLSGWIHPQTLLQRLQNWPATFYDDRLLTAALLRLGPADVSSQALEQTCKNLPAHWQQALQLALGTPAQRLQALQTACHQLQVAAPAARQDRLLRVHSHLASPEPPAPDSAFAQLMAALRAPWLAGQLQSTEQGLLAQLPMAELRMGLNARQLPQTTPEAEPPLWDRLLTGLSNELTNALGELFAGEGQPAGEARAQELAAEEPLLAELQQAMRTQRELHDLPLAALPEQVQAALQPLLQALLWGQPQWQGVGHTLLPDNQTYLPELPAWPQLLPLALWLSYRYEPLFGMAFEHANFVDAPLRDCPSMAQALFDLALLKLRWMQEDLGLPSREQVTAEWQAYYQDQRAGRQVQAPASVMLAPEVGKHDYFVALLRVGQHPWVQLKAAIRPVLKLLRCKPQEVRQQALDLLWSGLLDGRLQVPELATALATELAAGTQGLKYLLESLESLSLKGPSGEALVITTFEHLLNQQAPVLSGKLLASLLDSAYKLYQQAGRQPEAPARAQLENWAQARKKNANSDKARLLLTLQAPEQPPLKVWSLQAQCQQLSLCLPQA